jgi:sugar phosphate isomerase/epimerase
VPDRPALAPSDLVLCSGTIRAAPFDATVRAAAAAGFQGVSVYHDEYVEALARGWTVPEMRRLLDDLDIAVAEIDGRMNWLPGDNGAPDVTEVMEAAARLGARSVTVLETSGRRIGVDIDLDLVADAFGAVCDQAADAGVLAHIEYFPFSGIPDLATAYRIASRAGRPNGGVMVDLWHHVRGPDQGSLEFAVPGSSLLAVQVSDVAGQPRADVRDETLHGRLLPGTGSADVGALLAALRAAGCTAPIEVEVYSDDLAACDPVEAATRAARAMRAVLVAAGVA